MKNKICCLLLIVLFIFSTFASYAGGATFGNASEWAKPELEKALINSVVKDQNLLNDCQRNITREEFATLVVNLYRAVTKNNPFPSAYDTFTDTTNEDVLVAYDLGIINGIGNGLFAPTNPVTREQMGVMMLNAVKKLGVEFNQGDGSLVMIDKGSVSSWAVNGVDFAYENGFMKGDGVNFYPKSTTSVEQAVVIVNRVFEKYNKVTPVENDYKEGYEAAARGDGVYITYDNTGNSERFLKFGKSYTCKDGYTLNTSYIQQLGTSPYEASKYITFMDDHQYFYIYNISKDKFYSYKDELGKLVGYSKLYKGKYEGYYVFKFSNDIENYYAYDEDFNRVGQVYTYDKDDVVDQIDDAKNKFGFIVDGSEYRRYHYYGGNWDYGSTLGVSVNNYSDGPMCLVNDANDNLVTYRSSGIYEAKFKFNNEEHSNAGIVFNVMSASVGNDQYTGYYVGISPKDDKVLVGYANYGWSQIKEVSLGYDIKAGDIVELRVEKIGTNITVYVDGVEYIDVNDSRLNDAGYIGLRGWKANVDYIEFTAEKCPF